MNDSKTYYTIEIKYTSIVYSTWVPYSGEYTGVSDWWNDTPIRFSSEAEALNRIRSSDTFKDGCWRIVKTTIQEEVVIENNA